MHTHPIMTEYNPILAQRG